MENKTLKLIINSIFAGACIAFAAFIFLYASTLVGDTAFEKVLPSLLFGFGLFFIIVMEYKLFTGMVAGVSDMKMKEWYTLIICYVFNTLAILLFCVLVYLTDSPVLNKVIERSVAVMEGKLANTLIGSFISACFCGIMITFAVKANQKARGKGLSGTLAIIFPVLMFVFMGFEHCIANQAYIFLSILGGAELDLVRVLLFALVTALGNIVGGVAFPLLDKLANRKKQEIVVEDNNNLNK